MKVTQKALRARAKRPLESCTFLDLSSLELDTVGKLNSCVKLKTLILKKNNLFCCSNIDVCQQLWKLDLSYNQITNLDGFQRYIVIGSVNLSNNKLTWQELAKIRHLHILDLSLYGNSQLEKDPFYRIHAIDCLPHVWMLDGKIITSSEREQAQQFFEDSATADHPVRRKLGKESFTPTSFKRIQVNGVHGERTEHFMKRFPLNGPLNVDTDYRRILYLAHNMQEDLAVEFKNNKRQKSIFVKKKKILEDLILSRKEDILQSNMLLLLLVASLEFALPSQLVEETLKTAVMETFGDHSVMDLFLVPREVRCVITTLLLSACKVDKDSNNDSTLYDKLYLSLYQSVSYLTKLANRCSSNEASTGQRDHREGRHLIASEVTQLFCVVPAFFDLILTDAGIKNLVTVATSDAALLDKLSRQAVLQEHDRTKMCEGIARCISSAIHQSTQSVFHTDSQVAGSATDLILKASQAIPRRPQTAVSASAYHTSGRTSPDKKAARIKSGKVERRGYVPHGRLGDKVLLGPQNVGRIISVPEPDISLVQMDVIPAETGAMVIHQKNLDEHYTYIDMNAVYYDHLGGYWRQKGSSGDRITVKAGNDPEEELVKHGQRLAERNSFSDGLSPPPASPRSRTASAITESTLLQVTGQPALEENLPVMVSVQYKLKHGLKLNFTSVNFQETSNEPKHNEEQHQNTNTNEHGNSTCNSHSPVAQESAPETKQSVSDTACGADVNYAKHSQAGKMSRSQRTCKSGSTQEENKSVEETLQASLYDTLQSAMGSLSTMANAGTDQSSSSACRFCDVEAFTAKTRVSSASVGERPSSRVMGSVVTGEDDEEDEILYQAPTLKMYNASRRSSLESTEEGELKQLITESRPSTAYSRKSATVPSEGIGHATPECPIEIPQVLCDPESARDTNRQTPSPGMAGGKPSVREFPDKEVKICVMSSLSMIKKRPTTSITKRDIVLPSSANGPRSISALETYRKVVAKDNYTSQYQKMRTEAWRTAPKSGILQTSSPPPQRPPSPSHKQEDRKALRVSHVDDWLASGKDLYWQRMQKRPSTAHCPGWMEGLNHRPMSGAKRALRRSKTPLIQTPSSMAFDHSQYGRNFPTSGSDSPVLGVNEYCLLSCTSHSGDVVPGYIYQSHPRTRSSYRSRQQQEGRVCVVCQQQRSAEAAAMQAAFGSPRSDVVSLLAQLEPCNHTSKDPNTSEDPFPQIEATAT